MPVNALPVILTACIAAQGQADWKSFAPEGQGYTVLLPGAAKDRGQKVTPLSGMTSTHYVCDADEKACFYSVVTHTLKGTVFTPEEQAETLTLYKKRIAAGLKGETIDATDLKVEGGSSAQMKIRLPKGLPQGFARVQVIVTAKRVFQVQAFGTEAFINGKDADRFFDSFKLTK